MLNGTKAALCESAIICYHSWGYSGRPNLASRLYLHSRFTRHLATGSVVPVSRGVPRAVREKIKMNTGRVQSSPATTTTTKYLVSRTIRPWSDQLQTFLPQVRVQEPDFPEIRSQHVLEWYVNTSKLSLVAIVLDSQWRTVRNIISRDRTNAILRCFFGHNCLCWFCSPRRWYCSPSALCRKWA